VSPHRGDDGGGGSEPPWAAGRGEPRLVDSKLLPSMRSVRRHPSSSVGLDQIEARPLHVVGQQHVGCRGAEMNSLTRAGDAARCRRGSRRAPGGRFLRCSSMGSPWAPAMAGPAHFGGQVLRITGWMRVYRIRPPPRMWRGSAMRVEAALGPHHRTEGEPATAVVLGVGEGTGLDTAGRRRMASCGVGRHAHREIERDRTTTRLAGVAVLG